MNPEVTKRIAELGHWNAEFEALRKILLACGLREELKWEEPCYTLDGANIVLMHGFKEYFALLFFKGALMQDPMGILIQQTENVQSGRQIRFTSMIEMMQKEDVINSYIAEAIAVEKAGLKVEYRKTEDYPFPIELEEAFNSNPGFSEAFSALTPGRQRGYLLYFSSAKQSKTRKERIEKWMDAIFDGIGLQDEYSQTKKLDKSGK